MNSIPAFEEFVNESNINESVWDVDVNEPFNKMREQRAVQSFNIPQKPIKVKEIEGQLGEDFTGIVLDMTNGDTISYVYRSGGQRKLTIYLGGDSLSSNNTIDVTVYLDRYDGSTGTVTGDILLIYRDIKFGKIKIR